MKRIVIVGIVIMMVLTGCGKKEEKEEGKGNIANNPVVNEERKYEFEETKIVEENGKKYVETRLKNKGEEIEVGEVFIEVYKKYTKGEETNRRNIKTMIVKVDKKVKEGEEIEIKEEIEIEDTKDIEIECSIAGEVRIYE